jgi:DNA-binding NtrC family response regulator
MNTNGRAAGRRILVMDDNAEIQKDFKKILTLRGQTAAAADDTEAFIFGADSGRKALPRYEINAAYQGQEGLEMVRRAVAERAPYPVAFVDVRMPPGWDGIETISRVWEVDPDLLVIICTAYSDYSLEQMAAKLHRRDQFVILKKPFDVVEVQQMADAMVARWDLQQQVRRRLGDLEQSASNLRANRGKAAAAEQDSRDAARDIAENGRFLLEAFGKMERVMKCQAELLAAVKAGNAEAPLVARVDEALKTADLDALAAEIPRVIQKCVETGGFRG